MHAMLSKYRKFLIALVPFVGTLVAHFAGEGSDAQFVWAAVVSALVAAGVYAVPNA